MIQLTEKTLVFLKKNIHNLKDFLPLNEDKAIDLTHKIEELYVIPLSNAMEEEQIDKELLYQADRAIDDLNQENIDFEDFNKRI